MLGSWILRTKQANHPVLTRALWDAAVTSNQADSREVRKAPLWALDMTIPTKGRPSLYPPRAESTMRSAQPAPRGGTPSDPEVSHFRATGHPPQAHLGHWEYSVTLALAVD